MNKESSAIPGVDMHDFRLNGFKVHELSNVENRPVSLGRRDYYKMGLVSGRMTVDNGGRRSEIDGTALFFVNPKVPHGVLRRSENIKGYACLFTDAFFSGKQRTELLKNSPLRQAGDSPVVPLNREQVVFMKGLFQKMISVQNSDYYYKAEIIRNCIELILREALRIQPSGNLPTFRNAAGRLTHLFFELLEKQFPIEAASDSLLLRTPHDFASELLVHVNHLNRSVKEITGRPTTAHIAERIITEARALLHHTDCSVAEIAYALGFEYPNYFNNYFKRLTGLTPNSLRKQNV